MKILLANRCVIFCDSQATSLKIQIVVKNAYIYNLKKKQLSPVGDSQHPIKIEIG